jgi:hypothetical protein
MVSLVNFTKHLMITIPCSLFQKTEEEGALPSLFYETSIMLIPKVNTFQETLDQQFF